MKLQGKEQQAFQRREWSFQRVGTIVLVAFILAGFLGFLGTGPLATTTRSSANSVVTVEYDWVARAKADNDVRIVLPPRAVEDGTVTLELTGSWLSGVDIETISPEPVEQQAIPNGVALTFNVEHSDEVDVSLSVVPRELFSHEAKLTVSGESVSFNQFVLP